jgi:hypothetical protein
VDLNQRPPDPGTIRGATGGWLNTTERCDFSTRPAVEAIDLARLLRQEMLNLMGQPVEGLARESDLVSGATGALNGSVRDESLIGRRV